MNGFVWKNREFCLRRVFVLVTCKGMDLNKATKAALESMDSSGSFKYCNHPDLIPNNEYVRLREHASHLIELKGKEEKARQLAFPGFQGDMFEGRFINT